MPRASPILSSFNAGELGPSLHGRVDLAKYSSGCRLIQNFIPTVQGPAMRRAGFRYVSATKNEANRSWLVKFEFSATQAFVLEFGDLYVRFYTLEGVLLSVGVPYEIVSPYPLAALTNADGTFALDVRQSGDVLYIANHYRTYPPQKLTRLGNTNWQFSEYRPNQGPFLAENTTTTTIYSSSTGVGGTSVTLTASAAVFAATDVGRLVRLEVQNQTIAPWEAGKSYTAFSDSVRFDGKTYVAQTSATSGTSPPIHEQGTALDGKTGVSWLYYDPGYGVVRITGYTSPTAVTGTVISDPINGLKNLPVGVLLSTQASTRWRLGAWSATTEYPGHVEFFNSRLVWATKQLLSLSVPDDFENMSQDFFGEITADCAFNRYLQADDVNEILWLRAKARLLIGTGGGEFSAGEVSTSSAMGPGNFKIDERQSKNRVRAIPPQLASGSVIYVQRAGRKLLSMDYVLDSDSWPSTNLAVLSERITRTGIVATAYQSEPWSIVWCVLNNGKLVGFTYDKDQQVTGWHRHPIGGQDAAVESIAIIPSVDGSREQIWAQIRRTINGATHRYIEFMEAQWEGSGEDGEAGDDQADAFYVDAGLTYEGAATSTITGLTHLEGQTVQVLADGAVQPDQVVTGGTISLTRAASTVQVGLQYISRLVTMRLEAGSADGTAQGKIKRAFKVVLRFIDTLGGQCGLYGGNVDDISLRSPSTPMGSPPPIFSGDGDVDFPGDWETDCCIEVRQEQPLPMTLAAIMPQLNTNG